MQFNLDELNPDGAIAEAHEEVMGDTRLSFLKKAGIGAGAFLSGGAVLAALAPGAMADPSTAPPVNPFNSGDIGILNYALTLEYLENAFYSQAAANGIVKNAQLKKFLVTTNRDEANHVAFLKKALGTQGIAKPTFNFGKAVKDETLFAETAYALENTGVHAYSGQAGNITTPAYLLAALSIVTIEARHAGAIGLLLAKEGIDATGSFDTGYSAAQVLSIVDSTGFVTSL